MSEAEILRQKIREKVAEIEVELEACRKILRGESA